MTFTILNKADSIEDPTDKWPQSEPDSRDFADIIGSSLNLTGVVSGCAVTAQGTPDMTVAVASGVAIVSGTSATVSAGNVTITAAGALPRFDLICVSSAGVKSAVLGTGATNPVFPDPAGKAVLAAVYIPGSDTDIDSNQIVDKRVIIKPWVQLSGDTMTGNLVFLKSTGALVLEMQGDTQNSTARVSSWGDTSATSPLAQVLVRRFRGTVAAPLRTKASDLMGRMGGTGAHAADDVSAATLLTTAQSYLEFRASEAFTSTARGTDIRFWITPIGSTTAAEQMRLMTFSGNTMGALYLDDIQAYAADKNCKLVVQKAMTNSTIRAGGTWSRIVRYGSSTGAIACNAVDGFAAHHASCFSGNVTGAANNGSGLIRITMSTHPYVTGDRVAIGNVLGTTEANAAWTITRISATQFDLQGSTFANTYVSGGVATSAGPISGVFATVNLTCARVLSSATGAAADGDDVLCVGGINNSATPLSGTEGFYLARNSAVFNDTGEYEWIGGYSCAAYVSHWAFGGGSARIGATGTFFDASRADYDSGTGFFLQAPKDIWSRFTDSDGTTAPINFLKYDTSAAAITFGAKIQLTDTDIKLSTGTGTKIGTATTEKLAFHNSTPIAQQTVTGSRSANAALASLLTALAAKGLIVDGSSA